MLSYILSECGQLCDVGNVWGTLSYLVHEVLLIFCLPQRTQLLLNLQ